jgi:hypothetical protein
MSVQLFFIYMHSPWYIIYRTSLHFLHSKSKIFYSSVCVLHMYIYLSIYLSIYLISLSIYQTVCVYQALHVLVARAVVAGAAENLL